MKPLPPEPNLNGLKSKNLTLHLVQTEQIPEIEQIFGGFSDSSELLEEFHNSYLPRFEAGRRMRYGFYMQLEGKLAGFCLLDIDDLETRTASVGTDLLEHMRGLQIAPQSKAHLFYLAFELLGLNRVETGCFVSNIASKKSIEKTLGFIYEGKSRFLQIYH